MLTMKQDVDREVLRRLPLAEATLQVWAWLADDQHLDDIFQRLRGRQYTKDISFPLVVRLIADALTQHHGSGRQSFSRGQAEGILDNSQQAVYGKLAHMALPLSEAFLAEGTQRLLPLLPDDRAEHIPCSLRRFDIYIVDGKVIKRVAKLLKPLRGQKGGLLGGKALVALHLQSRLAVAMASTTDGEVNDAKLIPALLPQMAHLLLRERLAVLDSQFCDLTQTRKLLDQGDHFVVRAHPKVHFHPDAHAVHASNPKQGQGVDSRGRSWTQDWGWLGVPHGKNSLYVRRVTLSRTGDTSVIIYSDLLDPEEFPAEDLLTLYLARWGIERVFQQITEVFDLRSLIGTTPRGTIFQLSFCLLLYNVIQVVRAQVASGAALAVEVISTELLYEDVRRQLISLSEVVGLTQAAELLSQPLGVPLTAGLVRERLASLLVGVWTERWRKAVNKKPRPHLHKEKTRDHASVQRILQEQRQQQKAPGKVVVSP
jgi:hypothetical protein